jgi:hypothetical protein
MNVPTLSDSFLSPALPEDVARLMAAGQHRPILAKATGHQVVGRRTSSVAAPDKRRHESTMSKRIEYTEVGAARARFSEKELIGLTMASAS